MKAKQVRFAPPPFETPQVFKGGPCNHCGTYVPNYHGYHIGTKVYCNFAHFEQHFFKRR